MVGTAHVYQIYIAATPEDVWRGITDSEWTKRYFHGTSFVEPPVAGAGYRTTTADGRDAVEGISRAASRSPWAWSRRWWSSSRCSSASSGRWSRHGAR